MTSILEPPLVDEGTGNDRAALVIGLIGLADFYAVHDAAPLPGAGGRVTVSIPVPGKARGERIEALEEIAGRLGVPVTADGEGTLRAQRRFGPVLLEAHVSPEGSAHILRRIDAARDREEADLYAAALEDADGQLAGEAAALVTIAGALAEGGEAA